MADKTFRSWLKEALTEAKRDKRTVSFWYKDERIMVEPTDTMRGLLSKYPHKDQ